MALRGLFESVRDVGLYVPAATQTSTEEHVPALTRCVPAVIAGCTLANADDQLLPLLVSLPKVAT